MELGLKDKIAIVTGGARGIGKSTVEGYANEGTSVVISDILFDAAQDLAEKACHSPVGWTPDGLVCSSCGTSLEAIHFQILAAPAERDRVLAKQPAKTEQGEDAWASVPVKMSDVVRTKEIRTEEDLEKALKELREAVDHELARRRRVILH